jgi:hypothetical protein
MPPALHARRLLGILAVLGWLAPALATLRPEHPLPQGARRLVQPAAGAADPWERTLRAVAAHLPEHREVGIWVDRVPATPAEAAARGAAWFTAAHGLYPRRVLPLAPEPVIAALEMRGLVAPALTRVMRARLQALGRGDPAAPALLVAGDPCPAIGPAAAAPLRVLLAVPDGGCLLVATGAPR